MKRAIFYILYISILTMLSCGRSINPEIVGSTDSTDEEISLEETIDSAKESEEQKTTKNKSKTTWKRSNKTVNNVSLFVGDTEKLPIKGSQVSVTVDGFRARVLIDCFYYNDKDFNLEGTFKMRLPQGAKPYYFAFGESVYLNDNEKSIPFINQEKNQIDNLTPKKIEEIRSKSWSKPKIAKVVPKEKAALAYGNTVRRQIDPALAEWAGADVFNCRVFPLTPNKLHRIVIGYDVNLTHLNNDWIFNFPIPEVNCPLILDVNVANIKGINTEITPTKNSTKRNNRTTFRLVNPKEKEVVIRYNSMKNLVLQSPKTDNGTYFSSVVKANLPKKTVKNNNKKAVIALDISLSSNPDKFNVWLKLVKAILTNNRNSIKEFNILLFNIESFWWKDSPVENTSKNVDDFIEYANQIALEGASDINLALSQIATNKHFKDSSDTIFLLSDGSDTWGENSRFEIAKNIQNNDALFAFNTGMSGTNLDKLTHLTKTSGGAVFSVTGEDEIEKVSTAFNLKPWKIEKISIKDADDILIAGSPKYIYPEQQLFITGRGTLTKKSKATLLISQEGLQKELSINLGQIVPSELAKRCYGQIATEVLENFEYVTEKSSIAYAKHFNVPGKTCSLLMLDTEQDYEAYNIKATEDAFVVKSTSVTQIVDNVLADMKTLLGNSKEKFKKWLTKLTKTDGMKFEIPASLELVVNKIPEHKFSIQQQNLYCRSRFKNDVPKNILDSLLKPRLNYDIINKEAERRLKEYSPHDALKVLSSLVEKSPGDAILARDVAYSALNWNLNNQAYYLFKRVLQTRPYEPQTYLAIAKSLAKIKNYELSLIYYEIAITTQWNNRFGEFRKIAALDYLNLLNNIKEMDNFSLKDYANSRYTTLKSEFEQESADLMVVISWNTDNTDVDLHVVEPTKEVCSYKNRTTKIGGHITKDVTQGYGPEMYIIKKAKKGKYTIKGKYFSSNRNRTSTRTKVFATIYKNWGTKKETVTNKVIALEDGKEIHDIITIKI